MSTDTSLAILCGCLGLRDDHRHRLARRSACPRSAPGAVGLRRRGRSEAVSTGRRRDSSASGALMRWMSVTSGRRTRRVQQSVDVAVGGEARLAGHLLGRRPRPGDAITSVSESSFERSASSAARPPGSAELRRLTGPAGRRTARRQRLPSSRTARPAWSRRRVPQQCRDDGAPGERSRSSWRMAGAQAGSASVISAQPAGEPPPAGRRASGVDGHRAADRLDRASGDRRRACPPPRSAWASAPPIVPRFRTWRSPIPAAQSESARNAGRASNRSSSAHVVSAPITSSPSRSSMPLNPSAPMSTTTEGRAMRGFIAGSRD